MLGTAYAWGWQGPGLLEFAVAFGPACFAVTTMFVYGLGRRLAGRAVGTWAGLLVAVNGALAWGAASRMEVALLAALLTGLYAFVREAGAARFLVTPVLAALLALARPEEMIFTAGPRAVARRCPDAFADRPGAGGRRAGRRVADGTRPAGLA